MPCVLRVVTDALPIRRKVSVERAIHSTRQGLPVVPLLNFQIADMAIDHERE
jgi:hypothetical protein